MRSRKTKGIHLCAAVILLLVLVNHASLRVHSAGRSDVLVVSPEGPYRSIQKAVDAARDGQIIEVHGGAYGGDILIDRTVRLVGKGEPILDGGGEGTILRVQAPDVTVQGFLFRNSGDSLADEDAGLEGENAAGIRVLDNRFEDVLFGIHLKNAPKALVKGNELSGKAFDSARRGDLIRLWYSAGSHVVENKVRNGRDVLLWFSKESVIRGNWITGGRYGIHFMYNDSNEIEGNWLEGNSVGAFVMYSIGLELNENIFLRNRGPSGYGLGLKEMDEVVAQENLFLGNRVGLYLDNSPRAGYPEKNMLRRNVFALNGIGLSAQPVVSNNVLVGNSFIDNFEQVGIRGGGHLEGNTWSMGGKGNFWSDYAGYDGNEDGIGELSYAPQSAYDQLIDRYPELRLFLLSPIQQAIDLAAKAFPLVKAKPKLIDDSPLMTPTYPPIAERFLAQVRSGFSPVRLGVLSGVLLILGAGVLVYVRADRKPRRADRPDLSPPTSRDEQVNQKMMVVIKQLTKRYDETIVLNGIDLEFEQNESVALWGPNGAGKTTVIKCLLGLARFEGVVKINGLTVPDRGKMARAQVGYVPQNVAIHEDLTVAGTMAMWAQIRGVSRAAIVSALERVELEDEKDKWVRALSGGLKQRLALAVALLSDPPLLVLDEPTANLDASARQRFVRLLCQLKAEGKTILFTAHHFEEVEALADRVIFLEAGQIRSQHRPGWAEEIDAEVATWNVSRAES